VTSWWAVPPNSLLLQPVASTDLKTIVSWDTWRSVVKIATLQGVRMSMRGKCFKKEGLNRERLLWDLVLNYTFETWKNTCL